MSEVGVRLRIVWPQPVPREHQGLATEFGLQRGRTALQAGVLHSDGSTSYETEVVPYRDKQGRLRFRGDCVQGPPDEPFLYLSWRLTGDGAWLGRGKALLAPLTEEFTATLPDNAVLETTMARLGHRDAGQMTRWHVSS